MKKEIWVPAIYIKFNGTRIDFTGLYEVSNFGNCRSVDRIDTIGRNRQGKPIQSEICNDYLILSLCKNKEIHRCLLHRLVLSSFKPNEWFKGATVNHKSEEKTENFLENLEWVSYQDNLNYGNRNTKASESLYKKGRSIPVVQNDLIEWVSATEAARKTGINQSDIWKCCKGIRKTAGGSTWKFKNQPF